MWNSGSDVISRSLAVSSIQYGKPSPAIAYARCVCMTSLDRPVVPDVGISTARSSGVPRPPGGSRPLARGGGPVAGQPVDIEHAECRHVGDLAGRGQQGGVGDERSRLRLLDRARQARPRRPAGSSAP